MLPLHPAEEKPPCTNRACHSSGAFAGNIFQLISLDSVWDEMTITFPLTLKHHLQINHREGAIRGEEQIQCCIHDEKLSLTPFKSKRVVHRLWQRHHLTGRHLSPIYRLRQNLFHVNSSVITIVICAIDIFNHGWRLFTKHCGTNAASE